MNTKYAHILLTLLDLIYQQYPHISIKIESYWGTEVGHHYLRSLLVKNRERKGINFSIFQHIMTLFFLHSQQFGQFNAPLLLDDLNINLDDLEAFYNPNEVTTNPTEEELSSITTKSLPRIGKKK